MKRKESNFKLNQVRVFAGIFFILQHTFLAIAQLPFQDTALSIDARVSDLISSMTLSEKVSQLGNQAPAITRLGIPAYNYWSEALHGVARSGLATSFPQAIALSSTWDPDLIYEIASATSDEARVKNNTTGKGLTYWSPTINMARDPRWGRSEENYGEDTYLAAQIALSFIKGMQGSDQKYLKTVATAKHFACNNIEVNRYSISSDVDERSLREYYLPVFKACVTEGKVYSIMSAYNAVNGVPCPANRTLLTHILRTEWGFNGYVVSDCDAAANVWNAHHYVPTAPQATALSIKNGTDINCGTTYPDNTGSSLNSGLMTEEDLNTALKRVFKARFLLGEFDPPSAVPYTSIPDARLDCQEFRDLALKAAREAIVLLKNQDSILPLNKDSVQSIAVIGPNAKVVQLGGYSGTPSVSVSPLQGIEAKLGVEAVKGLIEAENYSEQNGIQVQSCSEGGSNIGYIQNGDYTRYDSVSFTTDMTVFDIRVASATSGGNIEVRLDSLTGQLVGTYPVSGTGGWQNWTTLSSAVTGLSDKHNLYLKYTGGSGYLFNVNWFRFYNPDDTASTGKTVRYAYGCSIKGAIDQNAIDEAATIAQKADVAIVICGTDLSVADEGTDRTTLNLPGVQEQLIQAVVHANPKTIVVLVTGFSLAVNWEQDSVPAIICAWYDGQAQGTAIADVIFGDYNPGGRLSTTWYKSADDLPPMNDYDIKNNRTYMYFKGIPLYPFGYGLSYTSFEYSNLTLSSTNLNPGDSLSISLSVKNTGEREGDEVVQLYAQVDSSGLTRPAKELKGFKRITLQPGETKTVDFHLKHDALSYYDLDSREFRVEDGDVNILVGSASNDVRLDSQIVVTGGMISATYRQDPFSRIEAEYFENKSPTVKLAACPEGGQSIDSLINGSYVVYKNLDFESEALQFNARLTSINNSGASIQIILDSLNGTLAGTLTIVPTRDLNTYHDQWCTINGVTGVRDVYLVFKSGTAGACRLNWFYFKQTIDNLYNRETDSEYRVKLYPNPASALVRISYYLPVSSDVTIEIYDLPGKLVESFSGHMQIPGMHQLEINTKEAAIGPGLYIVKFKADAYSRSLVLNIMR